MNIETLAVHVGHDIDPSTGAVSPPIVLSTTFARQPDYSVPSGMVYSRHDNPNRHALETALAGLEGGAAAVAFSSGMASINAVLQTLSPGDHALVPDEMYVGAQGLLAEHYTRWGLQFERVDMTEADNVARALKKGTKLVWVETPSNPSLRIADIARIAEMAHSVGATCVVDNTWASPIFQRPLELGADLVMHATTKYIGGHSDVLGGAIVAKTTDSEIYQRLRSVQALAGAAPSPFECWLLLRSIPSLPHRARAQCETAKKVAAFLAAHPSVETVRYPGLESHPQHAIAKRQMRDYGAMLSFIVAGGAAAALRVCARVKLFIRATSLGGYESLIEHRASAEGPDSPTAPGLLRCSIGLEHADDLIEDLAQALG